jgi:serine/threonine protein kinase
MLCVRLLTGFKAPEMLSGQKYTYSVDFWNFGDPQFLDLVVVGHCALRRLGFVQA